MYGQFPCFYAWFLLHLHQYKSKTDEDVSVSDRSAWQPASQKSRKASTRHRTNLRSNCSNAPWPWGPRITSHSTVSLKIVTEMSVTHHLLTVKSFHPLTKQSNYWVQKTNQTNVTYINPCSIDRYFVKPQMKAPTFKL